MLTFQEFSKINRQRCESPAGFNHALVRDGIPGNDKSPDELRIALADEIADTFISTWQKP